MKKLRIVLVPLLMVLLNVAFGCGGNPSKTDKDRDTSNQREEVQTTPQTNDSGISSDIAKELIDLFYSGKGAIAYEWRTKFLKIDKKYSIATIKESKTGNSLFHLAVQKLTNAFGTSGLLETLLRRLEQEYLAQSKEGNLKSFLIETLKQTKNKQGKSVLDVSTSKRKDVLRTVDSWVEAYKKQRGPNREAIYRAYDRPGYFKGPRSIVPLTDPLAKSLKKGLNLGLACGNHTCKENGKVVQWLSAGTGVNTNLPISLYKLTRTSPHHL